MYSKTKQISIIAMLCALAYVAVLLIRVPVVPGVDFLKYEPKDVVIVIGGFILGPMTSLIISVLVSLFEMISISTTGPIGLLMNVIATCAFACTAAFIYKRKRTVKGAVIGLIAGCILMTGAMIAWNYFITPLYMGVPRQAVVKMLIPTFLPFNLLKSGINSAIAMLLYKPVIAALRKTRLLPPVNHAPGNKKRNIGILLAAVLLLATCILCILTWRNVI